MTSLKIAVQMDPFEKLNPPVDDTLRIMRVAYEREHKIFVYPPTSLRWENNGATNPVLAQGAWVTHWEDDSFVPMLGEQTTEALNDMQVVLMRQDPPFDMAYITATYLLELLPPTVLVINNPRAVRDVPEKIFIARYPDLLPPTLISNDVQSVVDFRALHGAIVLKPLYDFGGDGVCLLRPDADAGEIAHFQQQQRGTPFIAQKFLPNVSLGDKRIIVIEGKIMGAFNRVPQKDQFLANLHAGGRLEATHVTAQEYTQVMRFADDLQAMGIFFAAIDMIDNHVTEINVTCPGGLFRTSTANNLAGRDRLESKFWDAAEGRLHKNRA